MGIWNDKAESIYTGIFQTLSPFVEGEIGEVENMHICSFAHCAQRKLDLVAPE